MVHHRRVSQGCYSFVSLPRVSEFGKYGRVKPSTDPVTWRPVQSNTEPPESRVDGCRMGTKSAPFPHRATLVSHTCYASP